MDMSTNTEHHLTDLSVAAFLLARGHRLLGLEDTGKGGQVAFRFATGKDEAVLYFTGEPIEARVFAQALKTLESALHQRRTPIR